MVPISRPTTRRALPVLMLLSGVVILGYSQVTMLDLGWRRLFFSVGVVYVVCGASLWMLASRLTPVEPSFRSALPIVIASVGIVAFLHLQYRHGLGRLLSPWSISFWEQLLLAGSQVTVPTVAALFLPLGSARSSRQRKVAVALLAVPFLLGTVVEAIKPGQFGFVFGFALLGAFYLAGTIFGSVLYVTGRSLRTDVE